MKITLILTILVTFLLFSFVTASADITEAEIQDLKTAIATGKAITPEQKGMLVNYEANNIYPVRMDPRRDDQGGPDDFGYKWIDSNEDGGPEFDWIDIGDLDGAEQLEFQNPDDGNSGALELGFEFPYYDDVFESICMCTNGWASFTDAQSVQYNNDGYRLPGGAIANQLAICMTDLNPRVGGGLWFWSDDEMAVLSWVDVPHYLANNEIFSFQIILYSNGRIAYNYLEIGGHENDIVIGIQNGARDIGLEVEVVGGDYLEGELSIRIGAQSGWVTGTVIDLATDEPIAEATLTLSDRTEAVTDEEGVYWLNDVPEGDYTLTASKLGYNSITSDEFFVADQETLEVDFALPSPQIELGGAEFDIELDPNTQLEDEFEIINNGNGELEFSMHLAVPAGEERDEPGDIIFDWNVREITGDIDLEGVATDGENFYITGRNRVAGEAHQVYALNRLGDLVRQFDQPVEEPGNTGFRGITTDGSYLYSADGVDITQFTFDGEAVATIPGIPNRIDPIIHIAYDPETDHFWISNIFTDIFEIDREGNTFRRIDFGGRIDGLSWLESDADGHYLYVQHAIPEGSDQAISKIDPENGEVDLVFEFDTGEGDAVKSCAITNSYNPLVWMLVSMVSNLRVERVVAIEMELNTSWVDVDPMEGTVEPESSMTISVDFDAGNWLPGQYELSLLMATNVAGDAIVIPLTLTVTDAGLEPEYFEFEATAFEHMFVIGTTQIRGRGAEFGDEIGAFTQEDMCIGAATWLNAATTLIAYGDDPDTDFTEGFTDGEEPVFKVWDEDAELEFEARLTVFAGDEVYTPDGSTRGTLEVAGFVLDQNIELPLGWSIISSNLIFDHDEIPWLFRNIVERGSLILVKDQEGQFYSPPDFNNIPGWSISEGYMVKAVHSDILTLTGELIAPDEVIGLEAGWNLISYYPDWEVDARVAFAPLLENNNLNIVKDGLGHFYLPEWNFSNIGNAAAGNGYFVNLENGIEFQYPAEEVGGDAIPMMSELPLKHLTQPISTGTNMSWLVRSTGGLEDVEIAVINSKGTIVGAARMVDNCTAGISVWGDDPTTTEIDGAVDGESLRLAYWQETELTPLPFKSLSGTPEYLTNGFTAIEIGMQNSTIPTELYLSSAYPNPFNDRSLVRFGLAEAGNVELTVYDLNGRIVSELVAGHMSAGHHSVTFDAHNLASGTYLIRLNTSAGLKISKSVLLR